MVNILGLVFIVYSLEITELKTCRRLNRCASDCTRAQFSLELLVEKCQDIVCSATTLQLPISLSLAVSSAKST